MVIDTNIKGIANILRHFLPPMIEKKQGIIVNMSSGWGRSAAAEVIRYSQCDYVKNNISVSSCSKISLLSYLCSEIHFSGTGGTLLCFEMGN